MPKQKITFTIFSLEDEIREACQSLVNLFGENGLILSSIPNFRISLQRENLYFIMGRMPYKEYSKRLMEVYDEKERVIVSQIVPLIMEKANLISSGERKESEIVARLAALAEKREKRQAERILIQIEESCEELRRLCGSLRKVCTSLNQHIGGVRRHEAEFHERESRQQYVDRESDYQGMLYDQLKKICEEGITIVSRIYVSGEEQNHLFSKIKTMLTTQFDRVEQETMAICFTLESYFVGSDRAIARGIIHTTSWGMGSSINAEAENFLAGSQAISSKQDIVNNYGERKRFFKPYFERIEGLIKRIHSQDEATGNIVKQLLELTPLRGEKRKIVGLTRDIIEQCNIILMKMREIARIVDSVTERGEKLKGQENPDAQEEKSFISGACDQIKEYSGEAAIAVRKIYSDNLQENTIFNQLRPYFN